MIDRLKTYLQNEETEKLISFINKQPNALNRRDENGSSGFMVIAYSGSQSAYEEAIKLKKFFSFHEAIVAGRMDIIQKQLENNSGLINTHSNDGFTPLSLAGFFNRTAIADYLLQLGADPNISATNPSKVNALHTAVAKENLELCKLLIENGAVVNAVQMSNITPLHSAVHSGNLSIVKLLIQNKAVISSKMDNGDTALHIAERENYPEIARYISEVQLL